MPVATCVARTRFVDAMREEGERIRAGQGGGGVREGEGSSGGGGGSAQGGNVGDALRAVGARRAGVVVSGTGGEWGVGMERLEVDVGGEEGSGGQRWRCRDCFGLRTGVGEKDVGGLRIEGTVMTAAATAGLGFWWVTVFGGVRVRWMRWLGLRVGG